MAYSQPMSRRRRATALGLTIAIHLLVALIIWNLPPSIFVRPSSDTLATFDVASSSGEAPAAAPAQRADRRPQRAPQRPSPPRTTTPPPPPPEVQLPIPEFMRMTRDQFAATDLSRLPRTAPREKSVDDGPSANVAARASNSDRDTPLVAGAGPGGARVFKAQWVREPTDAELHQYVPSPPLPSWAMVYCRSVPNNRVDNCQLAGESPMGFHLATGVRRAAWQFQVRPPRLNGKPLIGEWILIRITFTEGGVGIED